MRKSSWSVFGRLLERQSLIAGVAGAAALFAVPSLSAADEVFQANLGQLLVPGSGPLTSFDISWVDPDLGGSGLPFYLFADRSHAQVVSIPIEANPPSFFIKNNSFAFAGNVLCPDLAANDCAGPNGVLSITNPAGDDQFEIWVGDGPTANAFCPAGFSPCSTVKVFQNFTANLLAVIPTATGTNFPGKKRADELCFAPAIASGPNARPGTILVANDADDIPYITFIATDSTQGAKRMGILKQTQFSEASAGIEQCGFDPKSNRFYLNLPEDSGNGSQGAVVVIDPKTLTEVKRLLIDPDNCEHPQGLAIDSTNPNPAVLSHILLGCNGATTGGTLDSLIIDTNGGIVRQLTGQGSADEVWFEPISRHFFLAEGRCSANCGSGVSNTSPNTNNQGIQTLGIVDSTAGNPTDPFFNGQNVFTAFQGSTTRNAHSVAAWSGTLSGLAQTFTIAFMPIPASGGASPATAAPFSSTLCAAFATSGCVGMIAVSPMITGPEM
jgi:hypothetical protein